MTRTRFLTQVSLAFLLGAALSLAVIWLLSATNMPVAQAPIARSFPPFEERVVDITTGENRSVRAILLAPQALPPSILPSELLGAVVLLAGGHGNLNLKLDGTIGWGSNNQLVRTRRLYAERGYAVIVPDIADEFKLRDDAHPAYRWSQAHINDLAAITGYARSFAGPVHFLGTSRAALSVMALAGSPQAAPRPDTFVVTSGMLMNIDPGQPSVERNVTGLDRVREPTLLLFHTNDECYVTPPSSSHRFRNLLTAANHVFVARLEGGGPNFSDPCQAQSAHGFSGIDDRVVETITTWFASLRGPSRNSLGD